MTNLDNLGTERATLAALAGFGSLATLMVAVLVFGLSAATGVSPIGGGEPTALTYAGMYGLAPIIASFGAALPDRAFGAGWMRSLLASTVAVATFFWARLGVESAVMALLVFTLAPVAVVLAGAVERISDEGLRALLVVSVSVVFVAFLAFSRTDSVSGVTILAALPAWVVLPAIAGLFQPPG